MYSVVTKETRHARIDKPPIKCLVLYNWDSQSDCTSVLEYLCSVVQVRLVMSMRGHPHPV